MFLIPSGKHLLEILLSAKFISLYILAWEFCYRSHKDTIFSVVLRHKHFPLNTPMFLVWLGGRGVVMLRSQKTF
jgi:hypothetical protein